MASERQQIHEEDESIGSIDETSSKPTPLPKLQLFITLLVQFAEPVTGLVIYPFINQLVRDTGINHGDETKTGYYAGLIESSFFLAECLSVVLWGYLSDRYGRRPVLLIGPLGLSISAVLFGLSKTFWRLLGFRCLQGVFNGNIGVAKSVIAEITDDTNVGQAYGYIPLMWSTGVTIAPFLGGILSKPAERWPNIFGKFDIFRSHPYFLPCAVAGAIALVTFIVAFIGLNETLPAIVEREKATRSQSTANETADSTTPLLHKSTNDTYGAISENTPVFETQTATAFIHEDEEHLKEVPSLLYRPLLLVYLNYLFLAFCDMSNSVLLPLMYSTPIEYGGLGLEPVHIGTALGTFGLVNSLFQSQVFGSLVRKFGPVRIYQFGFTALCCSFLVYPVMALLAKRAGYVNAAVVACIVVHFSLIAMVYMAYATIHVLIVQSVPEGGRMGTANGLGQMAGTGMRAIAPTVASSLFSVSIQRNLLGGSLGFYLLFGFSVIGIWTSLLLIDPSTLKKEKRRSQPSSN
ncbi:major facilitator superfamily multidrug-resistance, DHA1 sub-family [Crepidotus variabilis]|uniref:Major facilitator superfamily multidrug-resistance, DHA1 sub-family n=1 Tax=Crepidotus variabilis TaxID=179855 RepID=A0A9P6JTQ3_9AGAR|nr:major facilitator superfamily multidrug-resistance, DHA1 sub-family [Crepidotus variabilis]